MTWKRKSLMLVAAACLAGGCFEAKKVEEGEGVCTPGDTRCQAGTQFGVEICKPDGSGWETTKPCEEDQKCIDGLCKDIPASCGNGSCNLMSGETCQICPQDCGECCPNGTCEPQYGENAETCPEDCQLDGGVGDTTVDTTDDITAPCSVVFSDDFDDDDISDWTADSLYSLSNDPTMNKLPAVVSKVYQHAETHSGAGGHHQALSLVGIAFEIRARIRAKLIQRLSSIVGLFADDQRESCDNDASTCGHGSLCWWPPGDKKAAGGTPGEVTVELVNGKIPTVLARAELEDAQADEAWHELACIHKQDGTWAIELDGTALTLQTNTTDSTFTSFSHVSTYLEAESTLFSLDDIEIKDCF